jgi:hypothetical protein
MKKLLLTACLACACVASFAATNLFDASDVDSRGWLWFDTQAKIDKYVGEGKLVQLVPSGVPNADGELPEPTCDPTLVKTGKNWNTGDTAYTRTGAIILPPSESNSAQNGGAILMKISSCDSLAFCFSSDDYSLRPMLKGTADMNAETIDFIKIRSIYNLFPLKKAGILEWGVSTFATTNSTFTKIKGTTPCQVLLVNGIMNPMYVHGIYAMATPLAGVENVGKNVNNDLTYFGNIARTVNEATISVFDPMGRLCMSATGTEADLSNLAKGLYVVRAKMADGTATKKVAVK